VAQINDKNIHHPSATSIIVGQQKLSETFKCHLFCDLAKLVGMYFTN
jgi:hypothetical protein